MTRSEAKRYLQQIQRKNILIDQKLKQLSELKRLGAYKAIDYTADKVQSSPSDKMLDIVGRWVDLEAEIDREIDCYVDLKDKIIREIEQIKDVRFMQILLFRYVDGFNLRGIAETMSYDYDYACKLHGRALSAFARMKSGQ